MRVLRADARTDTNVGPARTSVPAAVPTSASVTHAVISLLGEITFDHVVLQVADDPDQKLVTFSAADGDQEQLARLAATVAQGATDAARHGGGSVGFPS
jgi:hypothetical protein